MLNPLVSIVINNYNYRRFLGEAIQSALDQTYSHVEVIVVDDGSIDDSADIITSYGSRIRPIFKPNGGQASAYNAGFKESRGELILYLDADDFIFPTAVREVVQLWDRTSITKIHYYLAVVDANASFTGAIVPSGELSDGNVQATILASGHYNCPPASGNVYSREALTKILPMPENASSVAADTYTIFLTPLLGEIRACEKVLGAYRVHGANQGSDTKVTGPLLRYRLTKEQRRDDLLADYCSRHGLAYRRGSVQAHFINQKLRLASFIIDPAGHPYPTDTRVGLAREAAKACLRYDGSNPAKKAFIICWILMLLVLPRAWAQNAVEAAFLPAKRSRFANRFLQFSNPARNFSGDAPD
jgi:glycosyltransferase involved in cell wall biosynthesis